jgi:hypothetical protein
MVGKNSTVAVYANPADVEGAVRELQKSGFDTKKISVVGRDENKEEQVIGYYFTGEKAGHIGRLGKLWAGVWLFLLGSALVFVPGLGLVVAAGPIVSGIVAALEGAVIIAGLSTIGIALYSLGIPKEKVIKYETFLKEDKFLLVFHGSAEEVDRAHAILDSTHPVETSVHHE